MPITQCPECEARYRIKAHQAELFAGKTATCRRCRARFKVEFLPASTSEQATANEEEQRQSARARRRRTKTEIRGEYVQQVADGLRTLHSRLREIDRTPKSSEEEVRRWVVDVLRTSFGYDDRDIRTEEKVHDRKVDIVLRTDPDGPPCFVFEIKNIRRSLNQRVIDQATSYAIGLGSPYAVVTNGAVWRLFRSCGKEGLSEIFDVALLDEDGVSDEDAELLYLISKRAYMSADTERQTHLVAATNPTRLVAALVDEGVVSKLRRTLETRYRDETKVKVALDSDELKDRLGELLSPESL